MADKRERNPWNDRYGGDEDAESESEENSKRSKTAESDMNAETSEATETTETAEMAESEETAETAESEETDEGETVRERKNVNMYLPEGLVGDLQLRYSELNVEWRRRHDEDMPKNDEFYPAVIRSALGDASIEEELGLD